MFRALPSNVPIRIITITAGVNPMFEKATPTTPTKTRLATANKISKRITKKRKLVEVDGFSAQDT
jgi:hypothetical protein